MALDDLSDTANDTYVGGSFYMMWWEAGDSTMKAGLVCSDDATADEEIIVCAVNGIPFAVTALQATVDINTAVTAGVMYEYYRLHTGTVLRLVHEDDAGTMAKGQAMVISINGDAGTIQSGTTAEKVVGYSMEYDATAQANWRQVIT